MQLKSTCKPKSAYEPNVCHICSHTFLFLRKKTLQYEILCINIKSSSINSLTITGLLCIMHIFQLDYFG